MKKMPISLGCVASLILVASSPALGQATQKTLFITNNVGSPGSLTVFTVSPAGALTFVARYTNVGVNPQDVGVSADGRHVFILNATASVTTEDIYTARVNPDSTLVVNPVPDTVGDGPLSLHVTPRDHVLVPSATLDTLNSYRLDSPGNSLTFVNALFAGGFPTKTIATPDGKFGYAIGSSSPNDICQFAIASDGTLTPLGCLDIAGASGFGAAFHPSGDTLYISTATTNTVLAFPLDLGTGLLTAPTSYPSGTAGNSSAVEMAMHPEGTFLYVCHVVSDTLSVLRVNPDRSLSTTGFTYTIGSDIRDVITDGTFVYVSDESTLGGSQVGVVVYSINTDGSLTALGPATPTQGGRPQFMALWTPPPAFCPGDADGDRDVNFADITAVLANFGLAGPLGDADNDGDVDFADITAVLANFGLPCP